MNKMAASNILTVSMVTLHKDLQAREGMATSEDVLFTIPQSLGQHASGQKSVNESHWEPRCFEGTVHCPIYGRLLKACFLYDLESCRLEHLTSHDTCWSTSLSDSLGSTMIRSGACPGKYLRLHIHRRLDRCGGPRPIARRICRR